MNILSGGSSVIAGSGLNAPLLYPGAPVNGTDEVQTLTFGGTFLAGDTFRITFDGYETADIAWSATNNTLRDNTDAALEALPNIGASGVTTAVGTMTTGIGTLTLTGAGNLGRLNIPLMVVSNVTSTSGTASIATTTPGVDATGRGCAAGALLIDVTNLALYQNTGTSLAPTWTVFTPDPDSFFTEAEILAKFATDSVTNAVLLQVVLDGAFQADTATRALFADAIWTQAKLSPNAMDGTIAANVANANVIGGIPVMHRIDVAAGTTGNVDTTLTHKTRITDVWLVKTAAAGGGAGTIQIKNGTSAITDAMSIDVNDQTVVRCATIDDAAHEIAAAGTLRIARTRSASTSEACTVYVLGMRVA